MTNEEAINHLDIGKHTGCSICTEALTTIRKALAERSMEHKDWCNSRATCVCDYPAICERAWKAALKYNKVVAIAAKSNY
jgi:hypothetical protein